jgi:lipopolysaccharide biosynthesis regulator YciM
MRRSRLDAEKKEDARVAQAPASLPAADMAARAVAGAEQSGSYAIADCQRKVDDIERRTRANEDYAQEPEEELAIGKCYQMLDNVAEARKWLQRAAAHRKTKARAEDALRELAQE